MNGIDTAAAAENMTAAIDALERIETSIATRRIKLDQAVEQVKFWRDGLGFWSGVVITEGACRIVVAQDERHEGLGASLWYPATVTLQDAVSLLLDHLGTGPTPKFMTPDGTMLDVGVRSPAKGKAKAVKPRLPHASDGRKQAV